MSTKPAGDFACNGLSNTPAHAEWVFTVTALAAVQPARDLEGGETLSVKVTSPEVAGTITLTVALKFRHPLIRTWARIIAGFPPTIRNFAKKPVRMLPIIARHLTLRCLMLWVIRMESALIPLFAALCAAARK